MMKVDNCEVPKKRKLVAQNNQKKFFNGGSCWAALPREINLLCWNYRRLGNLSTEQELGDLIRAQDPSVVFLAETWLDKARLEDIRIKLNLGKLHFTHLWLGPF